ncbi:hypothetical protein NQ317_019510 [Molorchus minor]|uniref:Sulfotransferase domain-containing protein n=1 Tax=Molorchus minor TaxID=1323400 RepID=A0ABQ9JYN5_9CUCU|nr:hypothetical protein NQ317_019510 [Molorchus minor]
MVSTDNEDAELDQILDKHFKNKFRSGYVNIKGFSMPKRFEDMQEDIYNWNVLSDKDVWISSFPKTGTTWTQEMVWMILNNLDAVKGQENLGFRVPFLELSAIFDHRESIKNNPDFDPPEFLADSIKYCKSLKSPVCLKTHLPWCLMPKHIQEGTRKPKIIYVTRNPKDTCVSYFNHAKLLEGYSGTFDDFCRLFLAGKLTYTPFWEHIFPYWERRHQSNILFVKYEEMIKDLPTVIRRVAQFLEKDLTDQQVAFLTDHLSFASMKKNRSVNYDTLVEFNKKHNLTNFDGAFMNSGTVGSHKTKMSPEWIEKFDAWTEEHLKGSLYSLE